MERHLLLALACLACAGVLFLLTLSKLGGHVPERPALPTFAFRSFKSVKTAPITELLSSTVYDRLVPATNQANPFYAIQLFPPTPPPPKTRKVEVVYQGFFSTSHGEKFAYVLTDKKLLIGQVGTAVVTNLNIADMNMAGLTLKDRAGKEVYLLFNTNQTLEVPVQ
jgi:hypothetical protein